jgi:hypothetical protein
MRFSASSRVRLVNRNRIASSSWIRNATIGRFLPYGHARVIPDEVSVGAGFCAPALGCWRNPSRAESRTKTKRLQTQQPQFAGERTARFGEPSASQTASIFRRKRRLRSIFWSSPRGRSGAIVSDPFRGGGTTILAADQLGRIGYVISAGTVHWHQVSRTYASEFSEIFAQRRISVGRPH